MRMLSRWTERSNIDYAIFFLSVRHALNPDTEIIVSPKIYGAKQFVIVRFLMTLGLVIYELQLINSLGKRHVN
jgi:hypothetical protein